MSVSFPAALHVCQRPVNDTSSSGSCVTFNKWILNLLSGRCSIFSLHPKKSSETSIIGNVGLIFG